MKLKISVKLEYPKIPADEKRSYETRDERDLYEQSLETNEAEAERRLEAIIKAFNAFA